MTALKETKARLVGKYAQLGDEFLTGALIVAGIGIIIFALLSRNLVAKAIALAYITLP